MRNKITPDQLYELSKEVLIEYPVDLTDEPVSIESYLKLTCYSVLEQFQKLNDSEAEAAMMSSIVALTLENFLLNLKMMKTVTNNELQNRS